MKEFLAAFMAEEETRRQRAEKTLGQALAQPKRADGTRGRAPEVMQALERGDALGAEQGSPADLSLKMNRQLLDKARAPQDRIGEEQRRALARDGFAFGPRGALLFDPASPQGEGQERSSNPLNLTPGRGLREGGAQPGILSGLAKDAGARFTPNSRERLARKTAFRQGLSQTDEAEFAATGKLLDEGMTALRGRRAASNDGLERKGLAIMEEDLGEMETDFAREKQIRETSVPSRSSSPDFDATRNEAPAQADAQDQENRRKPDPETALSTLEALEQERQKELNRIQSSGAADPKAFGDARRRFDEAQQAVVDDLEERGLRLPGDDNLRSSDKGPDYAAAVLAPHLERASQKEAEAAQLDSTTAFLKEGTSADPSAQDREARGTQRAAADAASTAERITKLNENALKVAETHEDLGNSSTAARRARQKARAVRAALEADEAKGVSGDALERHREALGQAEAEVKSREAAEAAAKRRHEKALRPIENLELAQNLGERIEKEGLGAVVKVWERAAEATVAGAATSAALAAGTGTGVAGGAALGGVTAGGVELITAAVQRHRLADLPKLLEEDPLEAAARIDELRNIGLGGSLADIALGGVKFKRKPQGGFKIEIDSGGIAEGAAGVTAEAALEKKQADDLP
jgi:hypothetical protein